MLGRKSLLIFATNLVGGAFGFVSLFFIGRYMTPESYGMVNFAFSVVGIASVIAKLGIDAAHIKRVSEGHDLGNCLITYSVLKGSLIVTFTIGVVVAAFVWDATRGFHEATTLEVLLVVALFGALAEARLIATTTFDALLRTAKTQALFLVEHLVRAPLIIVAALLFGFLNRRWIPFSDIPARIAGWAGIEGPISDAGGAMLVASAYVLAMLASIIVAGFLLRKHEYPVGRFDTGLAREYVRFAAPVAISSALYLVATRIDAFMIGFFWERDDVGIYSAAQHLTTLLIVIPIAVRTLFFPLMSEMVSRRAGEGVKEVALTAQRYMSIVVLGLTLFLVVWPDQILHIVMSDRWLPASPVLVWLSVYTILFSFVAVPATVNIGFDRPGTISIMAVVAALLNIFLNLIFIPESLLGIPLLGMGAVGAAIATSISEAVRLGMHLVFARRLTGHTLLGPTLWKHFLAAGATGTVMHLMIGQTLFGGLDRWYELAAGGAFGLGLYLGLLLLLRELQRKDLLLVLDVVHPVRLVRYFMDEVFRRKQA